MRISELAHELGVAPSTIRFYERIGLVPVAPRTPSGYRSYDEDATARLRFVTRAKRIGLSLEQIGELLPIWDGANCVPTHDEITRLLDAKRAELLARVRELERFAEQLEEIRAVLEGDTPPAACRPDLSCCVPATEAMLATPIAGLPTSTRRPAAGASSI